MMTDPDFTHSALNHSPGSDPEAELQKELQLMFEIDSQEHLRTYFQLSQHLNPSSWIADIQNIYRAIHTIKGSAVTVGADAVLHAAMALEDLLSDLRYLEEAPPLEDRTLHRMLLEAGELLGSCLQLAGPEAQTAVTPTVNRIQTLHEQIQLNYLPNWDELTQVHQEFAEQGFDLVTLELEMAINQLDTPNVPARTLTSAKQLLSQLQLIGQDLQLAEDWSMLLNSATQLEQYLLTDLWRQQWPIYFDLLKHCAKQSGQLTSEQQELLNTLNTSLPETPSPAPSTSLETEAPAPSPEDADFDTLDADLDLDEDINFDDLNSDLDLSFDEMDLELEAMTPEVSAESTLASDNVEDQAGQDDLDDIADLSAEFLAEADDMDFDSLIELELGTSDPPESEEPPVDLAESEPPTAATDVVSNPNPSSAPSLPASNPTHREIKIPVPLSRLNQSSQQVVETLLTARSAFNESSTLQAQLAQLTALTQESAEYISRLRQLQDDYALLRDISDVQESESGVSMERYRQGYTTINRLLENILRMSELGAELEGTTQHTVSNLGQLSRNITQLKDGIEASRLVPFSNLTLRARAILRDLTNRYDKPAHLEIEGEQVELDAGVIQQLEPALLHLLRNAYDHGIETMDERLQRGKPVQATIQLALERRGNLYRLLLQDDGKGIDAQKVSQIAQERGFPLTQTNTSADLIAVLCQPGFSSRSSVSEVSGRGVGMDVVANQITNIGGRLLLDTRLGQGTTFMIEIPAPQLLVPCVLLKVGERKVAVPTDDIRETILVGANQLQPPTNSDLTWQLSFQDSSGSGFGLAAFWHESTQVSDTAICVRISLPEGNDIWLIADDLLGQEELLIQPLPQPLVSPPALMGVSLQADGQLLSVLDPLELAQSLAKQHPQTNAAPEETNASVSEDVQTILVVDDAALMRRRLESSLNTYGFSTFTCSDGQEAWQWLQANGAPDMMITDVEMPNMDGFTLIDRCRQSKMEMPILVVSSRLSEEWGKEAERLGANDYLNKGFSTPELINCVQTHLNKQPAEC